MYKIIFSLVFILFVITACASEKPVKNRWYTASQVKSGEQIYQSNCQICHLKKGQGTKNWKQRGSDGYYPPPPLNGNAHTWHHNMDILLEVVQEGGKYVDGKMPGFKNILSKQEQKSVIAYVQSLWSDELYLKWEKEVNVSADFESFKKQ